MHLICSHAPVVLDRAADFPSPSEGLEREVTVRPVVVEFKNFQRTATQRINSM